MRTITLGIPDVLLEEIDKLVQNNKLYQNRSDVLREAIKELLKNELAHYKRKKDL